MITLKKIKISSNVYVASTISGTMNGSNKVFYTPYDYKSNRIEIYYNGQNLSSPDDFTESGSNEITLKYVTPESDDVLRATFEIDD